MMILGKMPSKYWQAQKLCMWRLLRVYNWGNIGKISENYGLTIWLTEVNYLLPKLRAAGSSPVYRSTI